MAKESSRKLDNSKQQKAQDTVDGWNNTSKTIVLVALYILGAVILFTILLSIITPYKYFPKEPKNIELQAARIARAVRQFHPPPTSKI